jgi:hypothetical protein
VFDFFSNLLGGGGSGESGGGGGGYGPFLAALATAGLGAFSNARGQQQQRKLGEQQLQLSQDEAEKQRAFEWQKLLLQLANRDGGQGHDPANMANVRRQAVADQMQAALQGQQNNQGALQLFLQGIQRPYGMR